MSRTSRMALLLAVASCCFAQAPTAELSGTVRDSSGAIIPATRLEIRNEETGLSRLTQTDELGLFKFPHLPPGPYRMTAQKEGFRTAERKGLQLHVDDKVQADFTLEVGALAETVSVEAQASMLETEGASRGAVIDNSKIVNLPLNGRNPFSLAALAPGVQPGGGFFTARVF